VKIGGGSLDAQNGGVPVIALPAGRRNDQFTSKKSIRIKDALYVVKKW
jgi:hypothetical protein